MNELILYNENETTANGDGWVLNGPSLESTRSHSLAEYNEIFEKIKRAEGYLGFWLGDAANAGKEEHGRGAMEELAEQNGYAAKSLWQYAYISRQFNDTSIRIEVCETYPMLTHKHFNVVCAQDDRWEWVEKAGRMGWTAGQLRRMLNGHEFQPKSFNHWSAFPIEEWQNEYPGQIPGGILQNVLHYTTEKGDLVIDPFGGGGNMALACERMDRQCITYDIAPKYSGMTQHDATKPFPDGGANLVFLDPPYWKQKQGDYEIVPEDLSNIEKADRFHQRLKVVFDNAKSALVDGGYCVLIIGASQTKDYYIDHAAEMYALLKDEWKHINTVAAAYPTSQYTGNDVENAKKNGYMLNLYTSVQIWQKD